MKSLTMDRKLLRSMAVFAFSLLFIQIGCAAKKYYVGGGYNKAKDAYERGDYKTAITYFQEYVNTHPESYMTEVALYYLGESYKEAGDTKNAVKIYERLINEYQSGSWAQWAQRDLQDIETVSQ